MRIKFKKCAVLLSYGFALLVINLLFIFHESHKENIDKQNYVCKNETLSVTYAKEILKSTKLLNIRKHSSKSKELNRSESITTLPHQDSVIYQDELTSISDIIFNLKTHFFHPLTTEDLQRYYTEENDIVKLYNKTISTISSKNQPLIKSLFPDQDQQAIHSDDRILRQLNLRLTNLSEYPKNIMVTFQGSDLHTTSLTKHKCLVKNCIFTENEKHFKSADAVIFKQIPLLKKRPKEKPDQIWIYFQLESPINTAKLRSAELVNWTATYRSDSVLNTPYEKFSTFANLTTLPQYDALGKNYALGKSKLISWFVSNCGGSNGRMNYVNELKKYARVDVYGFCGKLKCNRYDSQCFKMLKSDYKFYLAFENSNCRDYITEKFFWNALNNDIVPIVMGAHPDDYKKIAPPNSYIHVDEFHSPRALAEYLHILDQNDDLYNNYFRWKNTGQFINTKFICRLCALVNVAHLVPTIHYNLSSWWHGNNICIKAQKNKWATWKTTLPEPHAESLFRNHALKD